jgi:uncharacterized protein (DUF983 family)
MANGTPGTHTTPSLAVWRGLRRRCGRCGEQRVFRDWFHLTERCPRCGYRFVREEGSFTGVYLVNFAVTEAVMFVVLIAYVFWRGISGAAAPLWPFLAACVGVAVIVPVVFYPFAATTWAALDLVMRPLDPVEEAEAAIYAAEPDGGDPEAG